MRGAIDPSYIPVLNTSELSDVLMLAQNHAVLPLLYPGAKRMQPVPDSVLLADLKKHAFSCASRERVQSRELSQILATCQEQHIRILPLKGCIIKYAYPNPELRYMSDIDLLIDQEQAENMRKLMESLGHRYHKVDAGDTDVYISPLGMNYEIHLTLASEGFNQAAQEFAGSLLELARPGSEQEYVLELPYEEHYAYVLCHFVKHFIYGGIGIRQLMDLYICRTGWPMEEQKLNGLLQQLGLSAFHSVLQRLCSHWFAEGQSDDTIEQVGEYILSSGVFGTEENRVADRMLQKGTGLRYYMNRIFPPYRVMKDYFPLLRKLPFLLPFAWVWRAIRALLFRRKKLQTEIAVLGDTQDSALMERAAFYQRCGLKVYTKES